MWLMPEKDAFAPICGEAASILGKVVAVMRSLYGQSVVSAGRERSTAVALLLLTGGGERMSDDATPDVT